MYNYGAMLTQLRENPVVDGDTYRMDHDLGEYTWRRNVDCRLKAIDTAEMFGVKHTSEEYAMGVKEREWVVEWFDRAAAFDPETDEAMVAPETDLPLVVWTHKMGNFRRWLVQVKRQIDGNDLADDLLEEFGDSVAYVR